MLLQSTSYNTWSSTRIQRVKIFASLIHWTMYTWIEWRFLLIGFCGWKCHLRLYGHSIFSALLKVGMKMGMRIRGRSMTIENWRLPSSIMYQYTGCHAFRSKSETMTILQLTPVLMLCPTLIFGDIWSLCDWIKSAWQRSTLLCHETYHHYIMQLVHNVDMIDIFTSLHSFNAYPCSSLRSLTTLHEHCPTFKSLKWIMHLSSIKTKSCGIPLP